MNLYHVLTSGEFCHGRSQIIESQLLCNLMPHPSQTDCRGGGGGVGGGEFPSQNPP